MSSERSARYRVEARHLPFTPSWFWEIVDTAENTFVDNSLAHSRTVYESAADALTAGRECLGNGLRRATPSKPALERRAA
ncbi:MAG: hypothetical protein ACREF4_07330 [Gammaproteobacteria bacterium]